MSRTVELAIPCRLVTLKVLVGPERGLTTLEDLVARAIPAGRRTVEQQRELFRLPRRIILDVVHSLWSKGHVMVDFQNGTLELTDGARDMLAQGGLLHESAKLETRQFLFEPVTGQIFPEFKGTRRPREGALEVPPQHGVTEADLSAAELLDAVQSALRYDRRMGFRLNVLDVGFGSPMLRPPAEMRWLSARAAVSIDDTSERLTVTILDDDRSWGLRARQRMAEHLANLAEQQPDQEFVKRLRSQADRVLVQPETLEAQLRKMAALIDGIPELTPSQRELRQKELVNLATSVNEKIAAFDRDRACAVLVERATGYYWAVNELINSADRQIVIASPRIAYDCLNDLLPALRDALNRGVALVIMWGQTISDSLSRPVQTAFNELKTKYKKQILIADRSARTEACIVIQDNVRAVVGSHSPLAVDPARDRGQIAVLIEPSGEGPQIPRCVTDLLIWARRTYPYFQDGQRIELLPENFSAAATRRQVETQPSLPFPDYDPERADEAAVQLWAAGWKECLAVMQEEVRSKTARVPAVEVVMDGAHRDLIAQALTLSSERLAFADDCVDPRVANDIMAGRILERAAAGAKVYMMHPSATVAGKVGGAFAALASRQGQGIHVRHRRASVRAVLSDDQVVLGSYSPLGESVRPSRTGRVSQLGVRIHGAAFADDFARALGIPLTGHRAESVRAPASRSRSGTVANAALLLAEARRARGAGGFTATLIEGFESCGGPWSVLEEWERTNVPEEELRRAVALALERGPEAPPKVRAHWLTWLVTDAWRRRSFVEAAVVGRLLPRDSAKLPGAACVAAAALEVGPLEGLLVEAALELLEAHPAARAVAAAGAMAETLLWAGSEGTSMIAEFQEALPPSWRELAREAQAFAHRAAGVPLPLKTLAERQAYSARLVAQDEAWQELAEKIDHVRQLRQRFDFPSGLAMHDGLFRRDGLLTRIRAAADDPDSRAELGAVLPDNVHRHLDALVAEAGAEPIQWRRHTFFLKTVESIVRRARALLPDELGKQITSGERARALRASKGLSKIVTASWDRLFSDAAALPHPYDLPMIALLDRLQPLRA